MVKFGNIVRFVSTHKKLSIAAGVVLAVSFYFDWPKPMAEGILSELAGAVGLSKTNSDLEGEYDCTGTRNLYYLGKTSSNLATKAKIKITNKGDGNVLLEASGSKSEVPKGFPIKVSSKLQDERITAVTSGSGIAWFNGGLTTVAFGSGHLNNGILVLSGYKSFLGVASLNFTDECLPKDKPKEEPEKKEDPHPIKAVFIRSCVGQLYSRFPSASEVARATKKGSAGVGSIKGIVSIADGTINGVCNDLKASGVTDVLLPFKADDPKSASGCGTSGQLLYDSSHDAYEHPGFTIARSIGFDPLGGIINAKPCKGLRFHAWFPVFSDYFAAQMAKQRAVGLLTDYAGSALDDFAEPGNPEVVAYELELLEEIVKKYPVVGINLDYVRYSDVNLPFGYTVVKNADDVTNFVLQVRTKFPYLTLSADVFSYGVLTTTLTAGKFSLDSLSRGANTRDTLGQNGILPLLDVLMPMVYSKSMVGSSSDITDSVREIQNGYPIKHVIPILRGWSKEKDGADFTSNLAADIKAATIGPTNGSGIFTYESAINAAGIKSLHELLGRLQ